MPSVRPDQRAVKSATPHARLAPSASRSGVNRPGGSPRRRRAGSRGRARLLRRCARRAPRGAPRRNAPAPRVAADVRPSACASIRRRAEVHVPEEASLVGDRERGASDRARRVRPTSWRSAAASSRSTRKPGWSCAVSRQSVRDADRVLEQAAGVRMVIRPAWQDTPARRSRRARHRTVPASPGGDLGHEELEEALRSLRCRAGSRASATPGSTSAASSERTSSCSRSRNRSTRPSTRTASPSVNRPSSSSTSFQTRASIRPVGSTSSSARYDAPRLRSQLALRASTA